LVLRIPKAEVLHNPGQHHKLWFLRKKVERVIRLAGFPLKSCGNDEQKQTLKIVILGLDPGIQGVFNLNTKDTKLSIKYHNPKPDPPI